MNNQEAFNRIVTHLRKQGQASRRVISCLGESCAYRGEHGMRCAVGVLLTDEFYRASMEGLQVLSDEVSAVIKKALPDVDLMLLDRMQAIHDNYDPHRWEMGWEIVAQDFKLTMPQPMSANIPVLASAESVTV